ncbi:podocalyxin [Pseudophryne corroboree]|uniref:podocalyxin n=1 Tax=Pseudophryne corroboree TaxID=495146 RepID=UPI00308131D1
MIVLRLLLGVLCAAVGHDASTTQMTTPTATIASTQMLATSPPATTKPATNPSTITTVAPTSKGTTLNPKPSTGTVPSSGSSSKVEVTSPGVTTSTPQNQTPTATPRKTDTSGAMSTTNPPNVIKETTTSGTAPENSTTKPAESASGIGITRSTVAPSQPHHSAPTTTSLQAARTQQSNVTDAGNSTGITTGRATPSAVIPVSIASVKTLTVAATTKWTPPETSTETTSLDLDIKHTYKENITVKCQKKNGELFVKIHMKSSRICTNNFNKPEKEKEDEKNTFMYLCKALKPGYQPNKDKCEIVLGYEPADHLVILDAIVENRLDPKELYEQVKSIKKKDNYPLFSYENSNSLDEDVVSIPLISAIVSLAVVLLIIAAIYGCWHQRQTWKREQRLTEELQTMENGYHDNPTLEVMETSPEMQEKKGGPNGELGDSWIVPLDNLTREDLDEEDTHL